MKKVLGLVNLHKLPQFDGVTIRRSMASTNFLGRYAFIDFPLSNFTNSRIDQLGILVEKNIRSILRHLGGSKNYNYNTKTGSCSIMFNEQFTNVSSYDTDINNVVENHWVIEQTNPDYVVIAPAHLLYRIDFRDVIKAHEQSGASITMVYHKTKYGNDADYIGLDEVEVEDNKIKAIKRNLGAKKNISLSLETYVVNIDEFERIIEVSKKTSEFFNSRDIIRYLVDELNINAYEHKGYLRPFTSVQAYLKYSLELLNADRLNELFDVDWPIYTTTHDTPPTRYMKNSVVKNSIVSNGCIISGKVTNSILARNVIVEEGAVLNNCIIFNGAYISKNTHIENCIVDKSAKVIHSKEIIGTMEVPLVVKEKDIV